MLFSAGGISNICSWTQSNRKNIVFKSKDNKLTILLQGPLQACILNCPLYLHDTFVQQFQIIIYINVVICTNSARNSEAKIKSVFETSQGG